MDQESLSSEMRLQLDFEGWRKTMFGSENTTETEICSSVSSYGLSQENTGRFYPSHQLLTLEGRIAGPLNSSTGKYGLLMPPQGNGLAWNRERSGLRSRWLTAEGTR